MYNAMLMCPVYLIPHTAVYLILHNTQFVLARQHIQTFWCNEERDKYIT